MLKQTILPTLLILATCATQPPPPPINEAAVTNPSIFQRAVIDCKMSWVQSELAASGILQDIADCTMGNIDPCHPGGNVNYVDQCLTKIVKKGFHQGTVACEAQSLAGLATEAIARGSATRADITIAANVRTWIAHTELQFREEE